MRFFYLFSFLFAVSLYPIITFCEVSNLEEQEVLLQKYKIGTLKDGTPLSAEVLVEKKALDIRSVAWNIVDDWANFDRNIESATGSNLGNCVRNRFQENARIICVQQTNCNKQGRCTMGRSSPLNRTTRIFGTFFNNIANAAQADRRACYPALLIHEFSHSCDRVFEQPRAEAREAAAFTYWQTRFPGTSGWTRTGTDETGCGLD